MCPRLRGHGIKIYITLTFQWHLRAIPVHHATSILRPATVDEVAQIEALLAAPFQARLAVIFNFGGYLFSSNVPQPQVDHIRNRCPKG